MYEKIVISIGLKKLQNINQTNWTKKQNKKASKIAGRKKNPKMEWNLIDSGHSLLFCGKYLCRINNTCYSAEQYSTVHKEIKKYIVRKIAADIFSLEPTKS